MAKATNKDKLKSEHENKLIELYDIYYKKCLEDNTYFKAFSDVSKELFKNNEESELMKILNGVELDG